jgi:hypothetical protein
MTDRSIVVADQHHAIDRSGGMAVVDVTARVARIQGVMAALMKEGTHYGTIPGTPKPTLYQAGAELLCTTFRIAPAPRVEDLSTGDAIRYRVTMQAINQATAEVLGEGVGECSSDEEKYRWRRPVCDEEFEDTLPDQRREKWMRGKNGNYKAKQIRTSPADIANTVLKMAYKRALISMTRTVLACSDIFAQDLEDLPEELRETVVGDEAPAKPTTQAPQRKSQGQNGGSKPAAAKLLVSNVKPCKWTKKDGGEGIFYALTFSDGREAATFSESIANLAGECCSDEIPVEVVIVDGNKPGTFKVEELRKA